MTKTDNGINFSPPKKKRAAPVSDPNSVYLKTIITQNEEIIHLLRLIAEGKSDE